MYDDVKLGVIAKWWILKGDRVSIGKVCLNRATKSTLKNPFKYKFHSVLYGYNHQEMYHHPSEIGECFRYLAKVGTILNFVRT